jgi:DNA-binding transcriptional LysR family regulator
VSAVALASAALRKRVAAVTHAQLVAVFPMFFTELTGSRAMQNPLLEIRHLKAVVILAEALSYTRAARRLGISQPGLTRRIQDAERRLDRRLFQRNNAHVELTEAGRVFVVEARLALEHEERAIHFSKAHLHGMETNLVFGRSQYAEPLLVELLLSMHLPLHPNLNVDLRSEFAPDLVKDVLDGTLDLALVTQPEANPRLSAVKIFESPMYIVLDESNPLAYLPEFKLSDLSGLRWIVFDRRVHPSLYDALMSLAQISRVETKGIHHVMSAEEASHLVPRRADVAFMTKAGAFRISKNGLIARPLAVPELSLDVYLVARADNPSKLVSEFMRTYVKSIHSVLHPPQMNLPMGAAARNGHG